MNHSLIYFLVLVALGGLLSGCGDIEQPEIPAAATNPIVTSGPLPTDSMPTPTLAFTPLPIPVPPTPTPVIKSTLPPVSHLLPTVTPNPAPTHTPTATPVMEQVVEQGGYAFWPPWGYEMQRNDGQAIFTSESGVMSLAGGPDQNSGRAAGEVLDQVLAAVNQSMVASMQAGSPYPVTVGGVASQAVDLTGSTPAGPMRGELVTARPAEGQLFYAFALSPADNWAANGARDFDRLLNGVRFLPLGSAFGCPHSLDPTYGFTPDNPIRIGGGSGSVEREEQYLNTLRGPLGQTFAYNRSGIEQHGDKALSIYQITFSQADQPLILYLDSSSYTPPFAPVGFNCSGAFTLAPP
jgi:hypothetical protein